MAGFFLIIFFIFLLLLFLEKAHCCAPTYFTHNQYIIYFSFDFSDLIECQFPTIPTLLCNWTVLPSGLGNTLVSTPALTGNHVSQSALIKFESECTTCKHTAGQVGTNVNKNLVLLFKCHRISHNRPSVAERGAEWAPLGYHVTID